MFGAFHSGGFCRFHLRHRNHREIIGKSSGNHREIIGKSSNIPDIVLDMLGPFRAFVILMVQRLGLWPLHINYIKISCILFYHHSPSLQVRYVFVCRVVMLVELMCDHHYGTSSVGAEAPWGSMRLSWMPQHPSVCRAVVFGFALPCGLLGELPEMVESHGIM